jgi:hypothetical protein
MKIAWSRYNSYLKIFLGDDEHTEQTFITKIEL